MSIFSRYSEKIFQRKKISQLENRIAQLNGRLDGLYDTYAPNQLFHDVTKFVVYNQIPGDYMEYGVLEGDTFAGIHRWLNHHWLEYRLHAKKFDANIEFNDEYLDCKRYIAFDSFEGLPPTSSEDTPAHFAEGVYKASKEHFISNIKQRGVDLSKVITIDGWFDDTLTEETKMKHGLDKISLAFIDCDLYESSVPVFEFLTGLIQDGTVLVIDDYFRYKGGSKQGIQRALNEWKIDNPSIQLTELARCSGNRVAFICELDAEPG